MIKNAISFPLLTGSIQAQTTEIFAHRGFRGLHTESTLQGFKEALHYTHFLELDVMISRDLHVIVTHDPTLHDNLYRYKGNSNEVKIYNEKVYDKTYKELTFYKIGGKVSNAFPDQKKIEASIPLLVDVLKQTQMYAEVNELKQPHFFIETKIKEATDGLNHPSPKVVVELLIQDLKKYVKPNQVIIQSFVVRHNTEQCKKN